MATPKRRAHSTLADRPGIAARVDRLERAYDVLISALDERLSNIEAAHAALDARFEDLFYRVIFVMEKIVVTAKVQGIITNGNVAGTETKTLLEFFLRDGEAYIAKLKREADALKENLDAIDARRAQTDADIREAIADVPQRTDEDIDRRLDTRERQALDRLNADVFPKGVARGRPH